MEKDDWHNLPPNLGAELTNEVLSSFLVSVGGGHFSRDLRLWVLRKLLYADAPSVEQESSCRAS